LSSDIASEASYNILDWTEKLLPPGKKKPKSSRAPAKNAANKEPTILKQLTKKKQPLPRPMPPLFKDDDDFELPARYKEPEPVKISAANEIKRLMENLSLLCEVKQATLVEPFKKMLDSLSLIACVEQEEKPDLDLNPPDATILDHIFADMRIVEKQTVEVIIRKTEVVTKFTPIAGNFAKRARFTSTPLRKSLPKRISSSFNAVDSCVGTELPIAERPEEPVAAPIIRTAFEFDIALESDESMHDDMENADAIECPISPVPVAVVAQKQIESSQETCMSDDLLCAAAEMYDTLPPKQSTSVSDIFKTSAANDKSAVPAPATNVVPDPSDDDDDFFPLDAIDQLEKQHQISKAELGKSSEETHEVHQVAVEEDDEYCVDEDDLERKLNEIQHNELIKKEKSFLAELEGPVVLSSDESNDGKKLL
jgi:hypothetical protein